PKHVQRVRPRDVQELAPVGESGVVDQQVDVLAGALLGGGEPLLGGQVGGQRVGADGVPVVQLGGGALQPLGVAGQQDEVESVGCETAGERGTDPRGRPG